MNLYIFISLHPSQLLPHIQLIPLLRKTMHLPIPHLKNRTRRPLRLSSTRRYPIVRFPTMAPLRRVPQQDVPTFREDNVVADDVQVGNSRHDVGVGIGVVEWRVAGWECGGGGESGVGGAEV